MSPRRVLPQFAIVASMLLLFSGQGCPPDAGNVLPTVDAVPGPQGEQGPPGTPGTNANVTAGDGVMVIDGIVTLDTAFTDGLYWKRGGNTGTDAAAEFIGTTDEQAFELRVNGLRALRLEPASGSPNLVGGFEGNTVEDGAIAATIAGGGPSDPDDPATINRVFDDFGTIGGGGGNHAGFDDGDPTGSPFTTIGGGRNNRAIGSSSTVSGGQSNSASATEATVGGGRGNTASAIFSVVGGGKANTASGVESTIGGGDTNFASGNESTVGGGSNNNATGNRSTVGGGTNNSANESTSTVGGGQNNAATASESTIGGGTSNTATGLGATIGGGVDNSASGNDSTVAGGDTNAAGGSDAAVGGGYGNNASAAQSTIAGGDRNIAGGPQSNVAGGSQNSATGDSSSVGGGFMNSASGAFSAVGGGTLNFAQGDKSTVGGGEANAATASFGTVSGGTSNVADAANATVAGGAFNFAGGESSMIPGGDNNTASGAMSFAAGHRARIDAGHAGAFVWADSTDADFESARADQFRVRANGGTRFDVDSGSNAFVEIRNFGGVLINTSTGANLTAAGVWQDVSDRDAKENFKPVDPGEVLARVAELPIASWNYKVEDPDTRHMGPVAQDFHSTFGLGVDDRHLASLDTAGVALAAIQGLFKLVNSKDKELAEQQRVTTSLRERIAALEARLGALEEFIGDGR